MPESTSRTLASSVLFAELADCAHLRGAIEQGGDTWTAVCDPEGARG